ncbi:MAG: nitroreductase/quinone reductase family protein [Dehalococcoidia bacterium]
MAAEYKKPGIMVRVMNGALGLAVKLGMSPQGANLLTVRGRKSGKNMTTPVNPMMFEGAQYLVSPRGNTHWARNIRASHEGTLRLGRKKRPIRILEELADDAKPPILLAYLDRWAGVTKDHFGIPWPNPSEADITRVCARTPMFKFEHA